VVLLEKRILFLKKISKKKFIQKRGLAMTTFDGSLGSDGPALFTATTRNSYSFPSDKPPQVPLF
jgi:hypothetical protein